MQDGKMRHRKIHNHGCYVRRVKYYANSCLPLVADFNFRDFQHGIFMVALWNRADITFSSCGSFLLSSSFFPRLISAATDWMSTILRHMVWP